MVLLAAKGPASARVRGTAGSMLRHATLLPHGGVPLLDQPILELRTVLPAGRALARITDVIATDKALRAGGIESVAIIHFVVSNPVHRLPACPLNTGSILLVARLWRIRVGWGGPQRCHGEGRNSEPRTCLSGHFNSSFAYCQSGRHRHAIASGEERQDPAADSLSQPGAKEASADALSASDLALRIHERGGFRRCAWRQIPKRTCRCALPCVEPVAAGVPQREQEPLRLLGLPIHASGRCGERQGRIRVRGFSRSASSPA